jgi:cardiolipin synthase
VGDPNISTTDRNTGQSDHASSWTVANLLTCLRIALLIPFLLLISNGRFGLALLVFFVASLTDFADGYIARRYRQQSNLGRILDPLADKLLTTAAFVVMAIPHTEFASVPLWLAAAVVGRDILIVVGSFVVYRKTGFTDFKPTLLGKVNTFVELGLIFWFLVFHTTGHLISLLPVLYGVVLVSVILSGGEYVIQGVRILRKFRAASEPNPVKTPT